MDASNTSSLVALDPAYPIWERFFTVAPLVVIGTREGEGYNLAPKHMAMPFGWQAFFGFICTPRHRTYQNVRETGVFTVSFPRPAQVTGASLAASPRDAEAGAKPVLDVLPTRPAAVVDGVFLEDAYLFLECELERVVDGFGVNSLIVGRVVAAQVREDALRLADGDDQRLVHRAPLLVYLDPGRYAVIRESFAFPFPARFQR